MKPFQDHFSGHAASYAAARPTYPGTLFEFLAGQCERHDLAWDCATGNGQAAQALGKHFTRVVATDASAAQIRSANAHPAIEYRIAVAERSGLADSSVNLITVAQALHWFDIPRFFAEAGRVLAVGGVLAFWCYQRCVVDADCDRIIEPLFAEVEPYWPPERHIVEDGYRGVGLPFAPLAAPAFEIQAQWTADQLLDYCRSWSAAQRYRAERRADPVGTFAAALRQAWGAGARTVRWPLTLQVGRSN